MNSLFWKLFPGCFDADCEKPFERMLSENFVIGADSAGTDETIKDRVIGYLYKSGSYEDLCNKLYYVITHWNEYDEIREVDAVVTTPVFSYDNIKEKICEKVKGNILSLQEILYEL